MSCHCRCAVQQGARHGPATVLSAKEEQRIVDYTVHMGHIGYRRTREQIFNIVAEIVSKDRYPNPGCCEWQASA